MARTKKRVSRNSTKARRGTRAWALQLSARLNEVNESQRALGEWKTQKDIAAYLGLNKDTITRLLDQDKCPGLSSQTLDEVEAALNRLHIFQRFRRGAFDVVMGGPMHYVHLTRVGDGRPVWRYHELKFAPCEGVFVSPLTSKSWGPLESPRSYSVALFGDEKRWLLCFQNTDGSGEHCGQRIFPKLVAPDGNGKLDREKFSLAGVGLWSDWREQAIFSQCLLMTKEAMRKKVREFNLRLPMSGEDCDQAWDSELERHWQDLWKGYQVTPMVDLGDDASHSTPPSPAQPSPDGSTDYSSRSKAPPQSSHR